MSLTHCRALAIVPVVVLVGLLAACTTAKVDAGPTTSPHSAPSSATPGDHQSSVPSVRVPLECGAIMTPAAVSALVDGTVTLASSESSLPRDITDAAARQRGNLSCVWGNPTQTLFYDRDLYVYIAADAKAEFADNLAGLESKSAPTAEDTAGDKSEYQCVVDAPGFSCTGNLLVGGYWASLTMHSGGDAPVVSQQTADSRMQQTLVTFATALASAPKPKPAWVPPTADRSTFCSTASTAGVESALGVKGLAYTSQTSPPFDAYSIFESDAAFASCRWALATTASTAPGTFSSLEVTSLRGGVWALPAAIASPPITEDAGTYAPAAIPGASSALLACDTYCSALLGIGNNFVQLDLDNAGSARVTAALTALVAAYKASYH